MLGQLEAQALPVARAPVACPGQLAAGLAVLDRRLALVRLLLVEALRQELAGSNPRLEQEEFVARQAALLLNLPLLQALLVVVFRRCYPKGS